ncbi:MAG: hypothetical protein LBJ08_03645 [Bifidobacteriaceae bacterium]|jgi:hypothetical protein|nr:hypothetical protein [Bifidobacteriaceae bacterium]
MKNTKTAVLSVTAVLLASATALSAAPAMADPTPGTYPPLAGTGSDTTQFVLGGLAQAILDGEGQPIIGSFDAVDPESSQPGGLIKPTATGTDFNRPNGSGAGLRALAASINPEGTRTQPRTDGTTTNVDITGQLDFARSSSGPSGAGSDLTFIPFAQDAVSYAYARLGGSTVPTNLSLSELALIYDRTVVRFYGDDGAWHDYSPRLPQASSGTRSFFLSKLGLTEADVSWISSSTFVQENDGSEIDQVGEIVPFSVGSYVAQVNEKVPDTVTDNDVQLGRVNGLQPVIDGVPNPAFPVSRLVFNVVETSRLSGTSAEDLLLQSVFAGSQSQICQAEAVIEAYGFAAISNCGDTANYKQGYPSP